MGRRPHRVCANKIVISSNHLSFFFCRDLPYVGRYIQAPFSEYLEKQKLKLHRKPGQGNQPVSKPLLIIISQFYCFLCDLQSASLLQKVFGYVILAMVVYFLISIVNSMAQNYAKRIDESAIHEQLHSERHRKHD